MLNANYHTHTARCRHASGEEEEYVRQAIQAGMNLLGFSDHTPYPFRGDYYSNFRMFPQELSHYVQKLLFLKEKYQDKIQILIGLEAEYYPQYFDDLLELLAPYPLDYLLLGQHFLHNEQDGDYSGAPHQKEEALACYVEQVITGIHTGKFAYIAHPDLCGWEGEESVYIRQMTRLCQVAKGCNIPLEMNFLGCTEGRHYPSHRFFSIAGQVGNQVIFGCDAHNPQSISNPKAFDICTRMQQQYGLTRTENIRLSLRDINKNGLE